MATLSLLCPPLVATRRSLRQESLLRWFCSEKHMSAAGSGRNGVTSIGKRPASRST